MIYHLLHVSTYPEKFLCFLIRNKALFDLDDHHFIIETNGKPLFREEILSNINYSVTKKGWDIYRTLRHVERDDKILVHMLGNPRHLLLLSLFPRLTRHIIWSVWGGDAYFHESWKFRCYEVMRKRIIPHISQITCLVKGDYEVIKNSYNTQAAYTYSIYPSDINDEDFVNLCIRNEVECGNVVLVGNSADPSNNHEQMLSALAAYKDQINEILVPLMYGGTRNYVTRVIDYGRSLFGDTFTPLTTFLPSDEYVRIISKAKVLLMNHLRQQGLGNAFVMLALKKKVYIRSDVTSFDYFTTRGIAVYDTMRLLRGQEKSLFEFDTSVGALNSKLVLDEVSEANLVGSWKNVFDLPL